MSRSAVDHDRRREQHARLRSGATAHLLRLGHLVIIARLLRRPDPASGPSRSRRLVVRRSTTKARNGTNPAATERDHLAEAEPEPPGEIGHAAQVDDVQKPVDRADDLDDGRLSGGVLERDADEHEHEQADADHVGHGPVAKQARALAPGPRPLLDVACGHLRR